MTKPSTKKLVAAGLALAGGLGAVPAHAGFFPNIPVPDLSSILDQIDAAREAQAEKDIATARQLNVPRDSAEADVGYNIVDDPIVTQSHALVSESPEKLTIFNRGHEDAFGNNRFGGGYQLKTHATAERTDWTANTQLRGYANTWARVFGSSYGVFTVDAVANTINNPNSQWAGIWYNVMVFGKTKASDTLGGGAYNNEKTVINKTQRVGPELSHTFVVFGVPVKVGAQVRANEYLTLKGKIWIDEVNATATPGGGLWVNAYAMAGIDGVLKGDVRGNIKLVDVSVPATLTAGWNFGFANDSGQCEATVFASANVDWVARQLDGSVSACAEIIKWEKCKQIASWRGFHQRENLFNFSDSKAFGFGSCLPIPGAPVQS
jgi:hypothetical protein